MLLMETHLRHFLDENVNEHENVFISFQVFFALMFEDLYGIVKKRKRGDDIGIW